MTEGFSPESYLILLKNPNWPKINTKKDHQNTLAKNQNRLHAICGRYLLGCFQASRWRFQERGVVQQNQSLVPTPIGGTDEMRPAQKTVNNPVQSTGLLEGPHRGTNSLLAIVQGHSPTPTAIGRGF